MPCRFLGDVKRLEVLSPEQQGALGWGLPSEERLDAAIRRAQKIRRFQLENTVKAKLDALKMQARSPHSLEGCLWQCV